LGDPQFSLLPVGYCGKPPRTPRSERSRIPAIWRSPGGWLFRNSLAASLPGVMAHRLTRMVCSSPTASPWGCISSAPFHPSRRYHLRGRANLFYALRIFADHALRVIPIQTDADGLMIDSLVEALAHAMPKFLYLIPTFQNPTGRTMPAERRRQLVELRPLPWLLVVGRRGLSPVELRMACSPCPSPPRSPPPTSSRWVPFQRSWLPACVWVGSIQSTDCLALAIAACSIVAAG